MIHGEKVYLGPVEEKHLPIMLKFRNDPQLRQYFREYRVLSSVHQHKWWETRVLNDNTWEYFVIHPKEDTYKVIGACGLTYIHPVNRCAEFAIVLGDSDYRGRGYGKDALQTLIRYGFLDLNLHRIYCEVYGNNTAIGLYRKLGFRDEGCMKDAYYSDGRYWDSYMLGMLRNEFDQLEGEQNA